MTKTHAHGTTFSWNSQAVASITGINGISLSVDSVEVTTHDSANSYKEFLPGLIDAGEVSLEGYFDQTDTTGQYAMLADLNSRTSRTGVITFPASTGSTWTFTGFLTGIKIGDAPIDGAIPFTATIKITGKPTFAIATVTGMSAVGFSNDVLMMPAFAIDTFDYAVTITNGETSTVITPVDATSGEVITITAPNGTTQVVATGEASSAIAIAADALNTITITISKANYAPKVYTFRCAVLAA